jgi:isopentenyl diphosphate isomerase/L-lactate dehydrogenase-like FMN-dependent dehydrogenase
MLGLRGIGAGLSFQNNFLALSKYKLKTRLISEHKEPVLETAFFGKRIEMAVLASSMSGLSYTSSMTEDEFAYCILEGARLAGTIGFTGHTSKDYKIHPGIESQESSRPRRQHLQTSIAGGSAGFDQAV